MKPREIIALMHRFNKEHRNHIQKIMEDEGLFYGQLPILETVSQRGCCTQRQIVQDLDVTPPCVATSVKRLVKKGYLEKKTDEKDQRNTQITITEEGYRKSQACRKNFDVFDEEVFACLTQQEKETLLELLTKLNESIRKGESQ